MSLVLTESNGAGFEPVPPGTYPAVCYMMVGIGEQFSERFQNSSKQLIIGWQIPSETIEIEGKVEPRIVTKQYTASLNTKARLRSDLVAWRGRDFTDEELKGFDIRKIVGAPCMLSVINKQSSTGKVYANVTGILALPKGMPKPELSSQKDVVVYDLETDPLSGIDKLPKWIVDQIKKSSTYEERLYAEGATPPELTEITDDSELDLPF